MVRELRPYIKDNVSITYNRADLLIQNAKIHLNKLHDLPGNHHHIYYNWLEEDGE